MSSFSRSPSRFACVTARLSRNNSLISSLMNASNSDVPMRRRSLSFNRCGRFAAAQRIIFVALSPAGDSTMHTRYSPRDPSTSNLKSLYWTRRRVASAGAAVSAGELGIVGHVHVVLAVPEFCTQCRAEFDAVNAGALDLGKRKVEWSVQRAGLAAQLAPAEGLRASRAIDAAHVYVNAVGTAHCPKDKRHWAARRRPFVLPDPNWHEQRDAGAISPRSHGQLSSRQWLAAPRRKRAQHTRIPGERLAAGRRRRVHPVGLTAHPTVGA